MAGFLADQAKNFQWMVLKISNSGKSAAIVVLLDCLNPLMTEIYFDMIVEVDPGDEHLARLGDIDSSRKPSDGGCDSQQEMR